METVIWETPLPSDVPQTFRKGSGEIRRVEDERTVSGRRTEKVY